MLFIENAEILNNVNASTEIVNIWKEHARSALTGAIINAFSAGSTPPSESSVNKWNAIKTHEELYPILQNYLSKASEKRKDLQLRKNNAFKTLDTANSRSKSLTIVFLTINSLGIILAGWSNILKK